MYQLILQLVWSILSYLHPVKWNHSQVSSMKVSDGERVPIVSYTIAYLLLCTPFPLPFGYLSQEVLKFLILAFIFYKSIL